MLRILFLILDTALLLSVPGACLFIGAPGVSVFAVIAVIILLAALFPLVNVFPGVYGKVSLRVKVLAGGCDLLIAFLVASDIEIGVLIYRVIAGEFRPEADIPYIVLAILADLFYLINGIIRTYITSYQLGIKLRVLAAVFAFFPLVNTVFLIIIIVKTRGEVIYETRYEADEKPLAESKVCATKYPILLVHGVFFRDSKVLNYWGRVPAALERCGAVLRYGGQQSALSVRDSAAELAKRIEDIVNDLGCEKVNVIAHSKGGLDSRYAISQLGADKYVASLTTVNSPHRGCIFVENLYNKISEPNRQRMAKVYNAAARKIGDKEPDFLSAVADLRESACEKFNEEVPDAPGVCYRSIGSAAKYAGSGRFPLNISVPLVRKTDGENDGLVAVTSMQWGEEFRVLRPTGTRGITHADMIDLNRENIKGFNVRRFYIDLVSELRERGF